MSPDSVRYLLRLYTADKGPPSGGPLHVRRAPLLDGAGSRCDGHRPLAARIAPLSRRSNLAGPLTLLARSRTRSAPLERGRGAPTRLPFGVAVACDRSARLR